jgi:alpha/beta superfamily hydrolase
MPSEIRSLFLPGPAGRLEALLNAGASDAKYAALVCHPHPMFGGTMHNKVVYHAMKALNGFGIPVLRFNFRGAGLSEGEHDQGRGEIEDVRSALDFLHQEFKLPLLFAGFSFGAATGLRAACPDPRVEGLISLGTPVAVQGRIYAYQFLQTCLKPKLFVSGTRDEYGPVANIEEVVAQASTPKKLILVEGADHFFVGKLDIMQRAIEEWVRTNFPAMQATS